MCDQITAADAPIWAANLSCDEDQIQDADDQRSRLGRRHIRSLRAI
jgi:hypothetical protein